MNNDRISSHDTQQIKIRIYKSNSFKRIRAISANILNIVSKLRGYSKDKKRDLLAWFLRPQRNHITYYVRKRIFSKLMDVIFCTTEIVNFVLLY